VAFDPVNPYRAPASFLTEPESEARADGRALFSVGAVKLALLSIGTLGLYQMYWFYENWRRSRQHDGATTLPPLFLGIFCALFAYPLFVRIALRAEEAGVPVPWAPSTLALFYLLLLVSIDLPGAGSVAFLGSFLPIMRVQRTAARLNVRNGLPAHPWSRISLLNWIAVVPGFALLALVAAVALGIVAV
jgi:hypothetical protein